MVQILHGKVGSSGKGSLRPPDAWHGTQPSVWDASHRKFRIRLCQRTSACSFGITPSALASPATTRASSRGHHAATARLFNGAFRRHTNQYGVCHDLLLRCAPPSLAPRPTAKTPLARGGRVRLGVKPARRRCTARWQRSSVRHVRRSHHAARTTPPPSQGAARGILATSSWVVWDAAFHGGN